MTKANDRVLRGFSVTLSSYGRKQYSMNRSPWVPVNESSRAALESALRCDCSAKRRLKF